MIEDNGDPLNPASAAYHPELPEPDYDAVVAACTGDSEPSLWRLTWLDAMIADFERLTEGDTEDPSADAECIREVKALRDGLWTALKPLADALEERQETECVAADGSDIPF